MKTFILLTILAFIPTVFAQTFMTKQSEAILSFNGTLLTKGINRKASVTVRETPNAQEVLIVMEVKHFVFPDSNQQDEFNETFMESHYFPQIRMSGSLKEKIDLAHDGIFIVYLPMKVTIRKISQNVIFKTRIEIARKDLIITVDEKLNLTDYLIPYSGEGSEVGKEAGFSLNALLSQTN
jgi:hypothetical protein